MVALGHIDVCLKEGTTHSFMTFFCCEYCAFQHGSSQCCVAIVKAIGYILRTLI